MQGMILTANILHKQGSIAIGMNNCCPTFSLRTTNIYTSQKLFKKLLENSVFKKNEHRYFANYFLQKFAVRSLVT